MADKVTSSLAEAKILVMQGMRGEDGKSPRVSASGTWEVWDGSTWVDTGIAAGVDETTIAAAVGEYLDEHPITVTETDPTVPQWAKQPTKPTYTAAEVGALPADTPIPDAVTEQTVSGWGFTKNNGSYSKPTGGIPKSDLSADVQTSLGKADTALQQHQSLANYQTKSITDTGGYFTTDTVEGALQEIGAELAGINTLIGSGVIS